MSLRPRTRSVITTESDEKNIALLEKHLRKTTGSSDVSSAIRYALLVAVKGLPR